MSDIIAINVSLWDSGALPPLLRKEIESVERMLRAIGDQLSRQDLGQHRAYLAQLNVCLAAVKIARGTP